MWRRGDAGMGPSPTEEAEPCGVRRYALTFHRSGVSSPLSMHAFAGILNLPVPAADRVAYSVDFP